MAAFLGLIAFLLYANTFSNGYVLDDTVAITNNSIVSKGIAGIPEIFHTPYLYGAVRNSNDLYRPLPLVMFAIEQQFFPGSPVAGHVINVLLFCCCVILLFIFLDELFERKKMAMAFLAALLFALHPIHTEVVANIKSGDELLCFCFAFVALLFWLRYARSGNKLQLIAAGGFFALSLLSKETALCFIALVPTLFFVWERAAVKRSISITASVVVVTAAVLAIRFSVLNAFDANHPFSVLITENALAAAKTYGEQLATAILTLGMYLKLLFIPYPLRCDYSFNTIPLTHFTDWRVLLSGGFYLALLITSIYLLLRRRRNTYALSILFFLIPLALFANIFFLVGATMAERFLFFPSVGFCLVIAQLLTRLADGRKAVVTDRRLYLAVAPIALVFGVLTIQRNSQWKDELSLYKTDLAHTPHNYRLPYYIASSTLNVINEAGTDTSQRRASLEEAIGYLQQSIAVYPYFNTTQAQAGITFMNLGQPDSAERHILSALSLDARDTFSRNNLAAIYFMQGRYPESIRQCRLNLELFPTYARAYSNIGACYLRLGQPDSAITVLRQAVALEPDNQTAAYYLSVANGMLAKPTTRPATDSLTTGSR